MEINHPDKGMFKGMGSLDKTLSINRKNFPLLRNKHQFQYTHNHGNFYESSFNYFHKSKFLAQSTTSRLNYKKVSKNSNTSQVVLGNDNNEYKSLNQANFTKYQNYKALKPIINRQEGFNLGNELGINFFKSSHRQAFSGNSKPQKHMKYKDWRGRLKFNPITGQSKAIQSSFGFEDFKYNGDQQRKYRANNFTRIPKISQNYDIISGRKLPYT